ncbi:MAG: diguanylate cyclase [Deltaproteobacteria bacterium]|nr:diguanylate cyclase [Deltaproteobacteria bacterium]
MSFKALLIHDDATAHERYRAVLAQVGGAETWVAGSCEQASTMLTRERIAPDLVVIDLAIDPRSHAPFVRLHKRLRNVPMIVVADEAHLDDAINARTLDYLLRPVRIAELATRVRAALRIDAERKRRTARERVMIEKLAKLERENHDLSRVVCADSLTGVANRRHVLSLLHAEWKRATRDHTPLSLVILDLDHFHKYNESYGHPGGDSCLRRVSEAIAGCLRRPSDFLGRYGGEEFLVVLANTDAAGARIVAERLRRTVESLQIPHVGSPAGIATISAGFATVMPTPELTVESLVIQADEALLHAKALGRNQVAGEAPLDATAQPTFNPWWTRFPMVVIDPWLAERIPRFLAEAREDVHAIHVARRARNVEQVRWLARKLKLSGREHGFEQIRELSHELDLATRLDDREAVRKAAVELERYVTYVQVVYRRPPEYRPA